MGYFYLDQSQAVIQPATERPSGGMPEWTDTAYLFMSRTLPEYMSKYTKLSIKEDGGDIIISGEEQGKQKESSHGELRIDKSTCTPKSLVFLYYNTLGLFKAKATKTWQYQNVAGLLLPKTVTELEYKGILGESPELESERTLMKSNWNVFDEITGTHYMTGNPGETLDKLSK
jgi:hypothetical protein